MQKQFIENETEHLSQKLQNIVDRDKLFQILPRSLQGIFEACFFMEKLNRYPDSANVWLVYLSSFLNDKLSSKDLAQFMFAFDFIYFSCDSLQANETIVVEQNIHLIESIINERSDSESPHLFALHPHETPRQTIINYAFVVNLLEDIKQDSIITHALNFPLVTKIFQNFPHISHILPRIEVIENENI